MGSRLGITSADRVAGVDGWQVLPGLIPRGLPVQGFASTALLSLLLVS
ncbi:hypothetical protein [Synechococcus sp. CBW1107]|nr:hypothetical protein [Synechococcus sp. CBW1107]